MRQIIFFFSFLLALGLNAQTPTGITYQAIVRDNNGTPLPNTQVQFRFSILDNAINGNLLYQETFSQTTNDIGLVNLVLGEGNPISGNYSNITWKTTNYLKVELDANNSGNYIILGINKLQAVPYSLFSKNALHAIYADTASFVKSVSGDKILKLSFGPTNGISTNNASGYTVSDLSKSLLNFNTFDYQNITSINFCVIAKSDNSANNFEVELIDLNTNQIISNSTITGNNVNYQLLESSNLINDFPQTPINLGVRIKSANGQDYVSLQKVYLIIQKGKLVNGATAIQSSK